MSQEVKTRRGRKIPDVQIRIWFNNLEQRLTRAQERKILSVKINKENYNVIRTQYKKGHQNIRKGTKNTKEHNEKISKAKIGHFVSVEQRKKQSAKMKGKRLSPSTEFRKGHIPASKGKPMSLIRRNLQKLIRSGQIFPYRDSKPEKMMQIALALNGIKFIKHRHDLRGYPDIFIEPNICIFIDGDFWHANPNKYGPETLIFKNPIQVKAKEIWAKDIKNNTELTNNGYQVIRIWESEIKKDIQCSALNIIKMIKDKIAI